MIKTNNDTICAISTKIGNSAINIVRMSGEQSLEIISKILDQDFGSFEPRKLYLRKIYDNDTLIDQVLVTYFKENQSYNNETIVEINTHGGIIAAQKVLNLLIKSGARMAQPGEFSKRAFLNGKMNMSEIEAVSGIITAQTNLQHSVSVNQLSGNFNNQINNLKDTLMDVIASVEVNIDYPEYDAREDLTRNYLEDKISNIYNELLRVKKRIDNGKILQQGINVAIVGKPNVGKSSLLNSLTNENSAIVSDIEGTTRDTISEKIKINDLIINLIDTAGIRNKTDDKVEKIGIEKSKETINKADLIFVVVDLSNELDNNDKQILELVKDKTHIIIGNKIDKEIKRNDTLNNLVKISALNNTNIDKLEQKIVDLVFNGSVNENDFYFLNNIEKTNQILSCIEICEQILENIKNNLLFIDFLVIDLTQMFENLSKINNSLNDGEILDRLFSQYCLGK